MPWDVFVLAMMGGFFIGMGAVVLVSSKGRTG